MPLRPRLIPCLLVKDGYLVKTVQFKNPTYVGDPINAVRIFNEKAVDELILLDISATARNTGPDYRMITAIANECRMPLCYGGGVKKASEIRELVSLGVEKVSLCTAAVQDPQLISAAASMVGSQSVVVTIDVEPAETDCGYRIRNPSLAPSDCIDALSFARAAQDLGAGEIVVNNATRDGMREGYDLALCERFYKALRVPLTFLGGAGKLEDISALQHATGTVGAAAGSLFVFKGRLRAVLISYPNPALKRSIFQ